MDEAELTPRKIVEELDRFIIGQEQAKKAVAVALRNRYRRRKLPDDIRDEVIPKNIIMIGPTGVGKTEIARRLARLVNAPFIKVEATKFTEVGYVGRDVDSMIRDLVETGIRIVRAEKMQKVEKKAEEKAEERILDILVPLPSRKKTQANPLSIILGGGNSSSSASYTESKEEYERRIESIRQEREHVLQQLQEGKLENQEIEIELEDKGPQMLEVFSGLGSDQVGINLQDIMGNMFPRKKKKRRLSVKDARKLLAQEEAEKLIDMDAVTADAIERVEQEGIVFLDELDKVAGRGYESGPDVSREGVQRDILPIVEGSTVMTKHGPVKTDHILFIAAGAFHVAKPSDLIPELQGRFPIRVELDSLTEEDFVRILTQPHNALVKQYQSMMATEGVEVDFTEDGIEQIARTALQLNEEMENIGARRLYTIMEKVFEDISFEVPDVSSKKVVVNREYVMHKLDGIVKNKDLSKYIL